VINPYDSPQSILDGTPRKSVPADCELSVATVRWRTAWLFAVAANCCLAFVWGFHEMSGSALIAMLLAPITVACAGWYCLYRMQYMFVVETSGLVVLAPLQLIAPFMPSPHLLANILGLVCASLLGLDGNSSNSPQSFLSGFVVSSVYWCVLLIMSYPIGAIARFIAWCIYPSGAKLCEQKDRSSRVKTQSEGPTINAKTEDL